MNIFVYGDESGVFTENQNLFVFGGLIFINKEDRDNLARRYSSLESKVQNSYSWCDELKANCIKNKDKRRFYNITNTCIRYSFIVDIPLVRKEIFFNTKSKQRYLDYVYKIGLKRVLETLIDRGVISVDLVENIYIYLDEHTTATDGRYELKEAIEQELKIGTFNRSYKNYYPPLFRTMKGITLKFCDSKSNRLVRASDFIANMAFYYARTGNYDRCSRETICVLLPKDIVL